MAAPIPVTTAVINSIKGLSAMALLVDTASGGLGSIVSIDWNELADPKTIVESGLLVAFARVLLDISKVVMPSFAMMSPQLDTAAWFAVWAVLRFAWKQSIDDLKNTAVSTIMVVLGARFAYHSGFFRMFGIAP